LQPLEQISALVATGHWLWDLLQMTSHHFGCPCRPRDLSGRHQVAIALAIEPVLRKFFLMDRKVQISSPSVVEKEFANHEHFWSPAGGGGA
jgi:hypothetical protein